MFNENELRCEMCEIGCKLYSKGYIVGMDGNFSVRLPGNILLSTPSGICKGEMTPEHPIKTDMAGNKLSGSGLPSSELAMHVLIYQERPDVRAVVHAHPLMAVAMSVAGKPLEPILLPEVAYYLGGIAVAPYATPGSQSVPNSLKPLLSGHDAIVLSRHGVVTMASSLTEAYYKVEYVEYAARVSFFAGQAGTTIPLEAMEINKIWEMRRQKQSGVVERPFKTN
jgi:L-fuculose-phosphate aldolase